MEYQKLLQLFNLNNITEIAPLTNGHINKTFLVECGGKRYVLQSLNKTVFRSPEAVMNNIARIAVAFEKYGGNSVAIPHYLSSNGRNFVENDGDLWRMYEYIQDEIGYNKPYLAGLAFGSFIRIVGNESLSPVIENFHSFDSYFEKLDKISPNEQIDNTTTDTLPELKNILSDVFTPQLLRRNIHGDAKLDNVLTGSPCTVIDLDTAMTGFAAVDFGDLVRSACQNDSPNFIETIKNISLGFAEGIGGILTSAEVNSLYYGILYVTGELAMRYFISGIDRDNYFAGKTPSDCLERASRLMEQLSTFRNRETEIKEIVFSAFGVQNDSF